MGEKDTAPKTRMFYSQNKLTGKAKKTKSENYMENESMLKNCLLLHKYVLFPYTQ